MYIYAKACNIPYLMANRIFHVNALLQFEHRIFNPSELLAALAQFTKFDNMWQNKCTILL